MSNIIPINRNNKFFSKEDFDFELELGMEYLQEDVNQSIILYEVDLEATNMNAVYKESNRNNIRFKTPKELTVIYEIEAPRTKSYENKTSGGIYSINGNLKVGVFQKTINDQNCEIKRGDYIGIAIDSERMAYFVVTDDGKLNTDNAHTMWGTKPIFRSIEATPVDNNEFNGM